MKKNKTSPSGPVAATKPDIRADAWINLATGMGMANTDKTVSGIFVDDIPLDDLQLSALYHYSDICAKIVDLRPEEMFRVGYDVDVKEDNEAAEPLEDMAKRLGLDEKILAAMKWGRLYGGALLILGFDKGSPETPLDEENPGELKYVTVVDRRHVWISSYYDDPFAPNFGEPEIYTVNPRAVFSLNPKKVTPKSVDTRSNVQVHASRCIRFGGASTDPDMQIRLNGWDFSVLQKIYTVIRDVEQVFRSMGYAVQDANQTVLKIAGLISQIASDPVTLQARMQLVEQTRAVNRAVLLDADEGEEFQRVPATLTGIDGIFDRCVQRLATASDIPVALWSDVSSGGLGGNSPSLAAFYNSCAREQETRLQPALERVYRLAGIFYGIDPASVKVTCCSLIEMTEAERADLEMKHAQKDKMYVDSAVLTPEEVAISRFGDPDEFGLRIKLNEDSIKAREESLKLALENPDFSGTNASMGLDPSGKPLPQASGGAVPGGPAGNSARPAGKTPPRPSNNGAPRTGGKGAPPGRGRPTGSKTSGSPPKK